PERRQHVRARGVRRRRPGDAALALCGPARPPGDRQGDVGRDLAGRPARVDVVGARPARLPVTRHLAPTCASAAPGPEAAARGEAVAGSPPPLLRLRTAKNAAADATPAPTTIGMRFTKGVFFATL